MKMDNMEIYDYIELFLGEIPTIKVKKNEYFVRQGIIKTFNKYYILDGNVQIFKGSGDSRFMVDEVGKEHFVGDYSKLFKQFLDCDMKATKETTLLCISDNVFTKLFNNKKFQRFFYYKMSRRIYAMYKRLLLVRNFKQREILAAFFIEHAKNNCVFCDTTDTLAEKLGFNKRNLYNTINRLFNEKIINKDGRVIYILNREALLLLEEGKYVISYMSEESDQGGQVPALFPKNYKNIQHINKDLSNIPVLHIKKNRYLFQANKDDGKCYYILSGVVKIENVSFSGKKMIVDILHNNEFVGFISNLYNASFKCSGKAETDIDVLVLDRKTLNILLQDDDFAVYFSRKTSMRIYKMYKALMLRTLFTPREILSFYILQNAEGDLFRYRSIYHICENLNISRRGIYNIFRYYERIKVLEKTEDSVYRIVDKDYLKNRGVKQLIDFMSNDI